jgi:hypothetical protein
MKKTFIFFFVITSFFCKAQGIERNTIDSKIIRTWGSELECKFNMEINDGDTSEYFALIFQNLEFRQIIDMIVIIKSNQAELDSFISDAEKMERWILDNKNKKSSFTINEFHCNTDGNSNARGFIMISPKGKRGYTFLTYKTFPVFIDYLKSRKISKG